MKEKFSGLFKKNLMISEEQRMASFERAIERGSNMEDSLMIGILLLTSRKERKLTVGELSRESGVDIDTIIDLECAAFPLLQAIDIAIPIKNFLGISNEKYAEVLIHSFQEKLKYTDSQTKLIINSMFREK